MKQISTDINGYHITQKMNSHHKYMQWHYFLYFKLFTTLIYLIITLKSSLKCTVEYPII